MKKDTIRAILLEPGCGVTPAQVIDALDGAGIEARRIWKPMHLQPLYASAPFVTGGAGSISEDIFARGVCLPSDTKMTPAQQERVIDCLKGMWK